MDISAFRWPLGAYVESSGFDLKPSWCATGGGKAPPDEDPDESETSFDELMTFIADEARHLADLNRARAVRLSVPAAGLWNIARTWVRAVRLTVHD